MIGQPFKQGRILRASTVILESWSIHGPRGVDRSIQRASFAVIQEVRTRKSCPPDVHSKSRSKMTYHWGRGGFRWRMVEVVKDGAE